MYLLYTVFIQDGFHQFSCFTSEFQDVNQQILDLIARGQIIIQIFWTGADLTWSGLYPQYPGLNKYGKYQI